MNNTNDGDDGAGIPTSLKWGKTTYTSDVDGRTLSLRPGSSARSFKLRVQSLTGVPVDRQKLLSNAWKGTLKDDDALPTAIVVPRGKASIVVTLVGTAETLAEKPPEERPRFAEDMTAEELREARRSNAPGEAAEATDVVDIVALQKEGWERDDGKMEMYQYNRLVTGLPQRQINDVLVSRKRKHEEHEDGPDDTKVAPPAPLLEEVAMTLGLELRRAYVNSLAVLPDGTLVSGLDDGHVQLWRRGQLVKDARHPGSRVDHVLTFPSSNGGRPSFATAGDGVLCLWTDEGERAMQCGSFAGTTPASVAAGVLGADGETTYLAACFRVTREVDPHRFRLRPQNEAERRRREAQEVQERTIRAQLSRASRCVKLWYHDGNGGDGGAVREDLLDNVWEAPITHLLGGSGTLTCGDAWGGIRVFEWDGSSPRQRVLLQLCGHSIACMEYVGNDLLAVSVEPEQGAQTMPSAVSLTVARPRGIHIIDLRRATIKAVLDAHSDTVRCMLALPGGSGGLLSAGCKMDATVRIWDASAYADDVDAGDEMKVVTGAKVLKQPGYVFGLKVLPDSNGSNVYAIAAARYNVIKIVI
ncbi:hypothetical protein ACHAWF_009065 [Thalassiosira exigua]